VRGRGCQGGVLGMRDWPAMRIFRGASGAVEISDSAWSTFTTHMQMSAAEPEAGGILLGRIIKGTGHVVVDAAVPPGRQDRRGRSWFRRVKAPSQAIVNASWSASAGTSVYLGEWHTHPQDEPHPSCVDLRDQKRVLKLTKCEQPNLLFVIVGRRKVGVWEGSRSTLEITQIGIAEVSLDQDRSGS
jgi:integrative and conjugative element protein (TIGR02256 family)